MTGNTNQKQIMVKRDEKNGKIWSHVRKKWLVETPEERVRQEFLPMLVMEYGYDLDQVDEEVELTGRGSGQARADFVVWRTIEDRNNNKPPLIIVECKSDNITIQPKDYYQGDNYARIVNAKFVTTHNNKETKFWRVRKDRMPGYLEEIENIPHANSSDKEIEELLSRLKTFKEDEFADLLHQCHNVIRNREKRDPVAAFDEIAKILFVKFYVERELKRKKSRKNIFNVEYLNEQIGDNPLQDLFKKTQKYFSSDRIFENDDKINLKLSTGLEIVRLLESYNLSDTSEDVKGIAFERFLGKTFRGEIGQFFTPRPIVEFMVQMVEPKEGDIICDPASGSGGFLIRFYEIVREQILADADKEYQQFKSKIKKDNLGETQEAEALRVKYTQIQESIRQDKKDSRLWNLANRYIYGTDANDRMARTSKMNMIMHGDGHGGVHHHDGFLNINGIFESRFDIILTNPPFGAYVEPSDKVPEHQSGAVEFEHQYIELFGDAYKQAMERTRAAAGQPISKLFKLPRGSGGKIKTEILFIERCLELLKPGGRMGIVLPEGIFNNPSLAYVRHFCEDRAFIRAIISLPAETFFSSGATVKASLLFMQKFTAKEQADFDAKKANALEKVTTKHASEIDKKKEEFNSEIKKAEESKNTIKRKELKKELDQYEKRMEKIIEKEARIILKNSFNYPIFLYDAEYVGISATGETDQVQNELIPNDYKPDFIKKTALELYREFQVNPNKFIISENQNETE
jgi:type I restriction enzyme M protein